MSAHRLMMWHDVTLDQKNPSIRRRDVHLSVTPAAAPGRGPDNLLTTARDDIFRVLDTHLILTGTISPGRLCSGAALIRSNLSSQATTRLRLFGDDDHQRCTWDSGWCKAFSMYRWGREFRWGIHRIGEGYFSNMPVKFTTWVLDKATAYRSWTLEIDDASNPDGFIEASRFILGYAFSPDYNFDWGAEIDWCDDGTQTRMMGGGLATDSLGEPYRSMTIKLDNLTDQDRQELMRIKRLIGTSEDVFVSLYPEWTDAALVADGAMHAKFTAPRGVAHSSYNRYSNTITLKEI